MCEPANGARAQWSDWYQQDGINVEGPAPQPLERFKITLEDDTVVVDRSMKFYQENGQWSNPDSFLSV